MGYWLKRSESLTEGVQRIAAEQVEAALRELSNDDLPRYKAVHQVRKRCKKLRGLLRLVRFGIGDTYSQENAWFRDAARELSTVRDAKTRIDTYDALMNYFRDQVRREAFGSIRRRLTLQRKELLTHSVDKDQQLEKAGDRLSQSLERLQQWQVDGEEDDIVRRSLRQTYQRGRNIMRDAIEQSEAETLHEWRKQVKYHWYHCRLLRCLWQGAMNARIAAADQLSDLLGADHDLAILQSHMADEPLAFGKPDDVEAFFGLIKQRRTRLQHKAMRLGRRLFAEKPKAYSQRIVALWRVWKAPNAQSTDVV